MPADSETHGPRTLELISVLEEIVPILEKHGYAHWARRMWDAKELLRVSDFRGIGQVLSAYGGMGSFGDIVLSGRQSSADAERLSLLRSRAYELAEAIRREVERDGR